jgi:hypothetical protein
MPSSSASLSTSSSPRLKITPRQDGDLKGQSPRQESVFDSPSAPLFDAAPGTPEKDSAKCVVS